MISLSRMVGKRVFEKVKLCAVCTESRVLDIKQWQSRGPLPKISWQLLIRSASTP